MNCTRVEQLTADYLGEELESGERARFDAHLADCDTCRARIAELTDTLAELNRLATVPLPMALEKTRGLCVVRRRSPVRRFVFSSLKVAAVLALGVLLGRASVGGTSLQTTSQPGVPKMPVSETKLVAVGVHPRWIELGRQVSSEHSSLASELLVLARTARK